jgi:hypothetical protein
MKFRPDVAMRIPASPKNFSFGKKMVPANNPEMVLVTSLDPKSTEWPLPCKHSKSLYKPHNPWRYASQFSTFLLLYCPPLAWSGHREITEVIREHHCVPHLGFPAASIAILSAAKLRETCELTAKPLMEPDPAGSEKFSQKAEWSHLRVGH